MWIFLVCGFSALVFGLLSLSSALGWIRPDSPLCIPRRVEYPAWSQGVIGAAEIAVGTLMVVTALR
jgi:hypothetical protein